MKNIDIAEWGTFKDSLKAPIYGWFTYPAGFSYKAAEHCFKEAGLTEGATVYDPFMGSATTNLAAKTKGFNSYGVEAHPFVHRIAKCKMNWDIVSKEVESKLNEIISLVKQDTLSAEDRKEVVVSSFPELVVKCFLPDTLYILKLIRDYNSSLTNPDIQLFLNTSLICCLRQVSIAATGWPYIAPNKIKITSFSKRGLETFVDFAHKMLSDMEFMKRTSSNCPTNHNIILGDSRCTVGIIPNGSADLIFTSPPYLNNFDYADRTRLEMYFMGEAKNWGDLDNLVRTKLITCATTQINRKNPKYAFASDFICDNPREYEMLRGNVEHLTQLRAERPGKKSYDFLVAGYFQDIYHVLKDCYRILRPNTKAVLIVGDSAPYGVHIPTDDLIGRIGCNIGFERYEISVLRGRGEKWKDNPQRHHIKLRESIVTLIK